MSAKRCLWIIALLVLTVQSQAQYFQLTGKVVDKNLQPIPYASVYIKETELNTQSDEKGEFKFTLSNGVYEVLVTMLGYKSYSQKIVVDKQDTRVQFVMVKENNVIKEITIMNTKKDRSEEIIKNVIVNKDKILDKINSYNVKLYIKANGNTEYKIKKDTITASDSMKASLDNMSMAEVIINLDYQKPNKTKETRLAVKKGTGNESFFYLRTTDGDFNFYNNLVSAPSLSSMPFLSPISNSGLIAYKFKTLSVVKRGRYKDYRIKVTPLKIGNNLVEGEMTIRDSLWILKDLHFKFPTHNTPEYSSFELDQEYEEIEEGIWLPGRSQFDYKPTGKSKTSMQTIAVFSNYKLDTIFPKKHFNDEVSTTAMDAYEKDGKYWSESRTEPLSDLELEFIRVKDSLYSYTHSQAYYDSIDRITNKIGLKEIFLQGITNYKRTNERTIYLNSLLALYRPGMIGGTRLGYGGSYALRFKDYKRISTFGSASYGLNNKDILGDLTVSFRYNPFNNGRVSVNFGHNFDVLFSGDAAINLLSRSSWYRKKFIKLDHSLEIKNGLYLSNTLEFANRSSLSDYKLNGDNIVDTIFARLGIRNFRGNINRPLEFDPYNAIYNSITLSYTHRQKYIREPRQKIVLGSKYPTVYLTWKKGVRGIARSVVDFDYFELGLSKFMNAGTFGTGRLNAKAGHYTNTRELRIVDYKWMRRGDLYLFFNPENNFQALDSTFPILKNYIEAHHVHEFNGALINKIPYAKRLKIFELAGAGIFQLPERNLFYTEVFAGLEKQFVFLGETYRIGGYAVSSYANNQVNPLMFKFRLRHYNKVYNRWE